MKFKTEKEKRQFVETTLSEGLEKAKQEYFKNHIEVIAMTRGNPRAEVFGELLTDKEINQKHPEILVVKVGSEKTKQAIDRLKNEQK